MIFFCHTPCRLRLCKGNFRNCMGIITILTSVILLFTLLLNLNHMSIYILHYSVPENLLLSFVAMKASRHAWLLCMLLFYTTLLMWDIFTKFVPIFPMPHVYCKSIANEHTLLNRKHICGASELFCTTDFT